MWVLLCIQMRNTYHVHCNLQWASFIQPKSSRFGLIFRSLRSYKYVAFMHVTHVHNDMSYTDEIRKFCIFQTYSPAP